MMTSADLPLLSAQRSEQPRALAESNAWNKQVELSWFFEIHGLVSTGLFFLGVKFLRLFPDITRWSAS